MNHPYNQIVLFGDSITQMSFDPALFGFGANLASAYQRKMDVYNRGFSGYNTDWALPILRQILPKVEDQHREAARIELMTIFFGANDAALPFSHQHVPLDRYKSNLKTMIEMIKTPSSPYYNPNLRLLLITPPPLNEPQYLERCKENGTPLDRTSDNTRQYAETVIEFGNEHSIPVVNIWSTLMERAKEQSEGLSHFSFDGLHLNGNGYKVLFDLVMETIQRSYPEIHPSNIDMEIPAWRELKLNDYENQVKFPLLHRSDNS